MSGIRPNAVVLVATIKALKYNGGVAKADLWQENLEALEKGLPKVLSAEKTDVDANGVISGLFWKKRALRILKLLIREEVDI